MFQRGLRSLGGQAIATTAGRRAVSFAAQPLVPLESPFAALLGRLWIAPTPALPSSRVQQLLHNSAAWSPALSFQPVCASASAPASAASAAIAPAPSAALTAHLMLSSTVKKRAMKMNKHKLKKRRKLLRMNTKVSRG